MRSTREGHEVTDLSAVESGQFGGDALADDRTRNVRDGGAEAVATASMWSSSAVVCNGYPPGNRPHRCRNDKHPPVRRHPNIAHELGHHLLEHAFDQVVLAEDHKRVLDEQQEKQATFMAGELVIPLQAAERLAFDGWDNSASPLATASANSLHRYR